jgi:hypothetical protein
MAFPGLKDQADSLIPKSLLAHQLPNMLETDGSKAGQFDGSLMLPFLNVVPDKRVGQERRLLLRELCVMRRRFTTDGIPLPAFAADNGFRRGLIGEYFCCSS